MALPQSPITRKEMFYSSIAGENIDTLPDPITREEQYLAYIAQNGGGSDAGVSSFNGRKGIVTPRAGDYTADMVGAYTKSEVDEAIDDAIDEVTGRIAAVEERTSMPSKSVSGNPITITNASSGNAEALEMAIEPIQDLHGYDKPWAGGAGKNKAKNTDVSVGANTVGENIESTVYIGNTRTYTVSLKIARISGATISNNALYPFRITTYDSSGTSLGEINSSVLTLASGETSYSQTVTFDNNVAYFVFQPRNFNGDANNNTRKYNIQIEEGSTATTFEPYSNICPISGYDEATVEVQDENGVVQKTATITLGQTVYGGNVDFNTGVVTVDMANIASYAGETITEPWISSMDEYVAGTTPTTGAQVVYTLATPTTIQLTPTQLELLKGTNVISGNGATITLTYQPDSLLAEAEAYVDSKIPAAPTGDGTYSLTVTVVNGVPSYAWES